MVIWLMAFVGSIRRWRRKPGVDACRDLTVCLRFDSPTCCADRIAAARSLERLRDERLTWGG
jgi:hypothetical protein